MYCCLHLWGGPGGVPGGCLIRPGGGECSLRVLAVCLLVPSAVYGGSFEH